MAKLHVTDLVDHTVLIRLNEDELRAVQEIAHELDWTAVDLTKKQDKGFRSFLRVVDSAIRSLGADHED